jgi:hypothetical protein
MDAGESGSTYQSAAIASDANTILHFFGDRKNPVGSEVYPNRGIYGIDTTASQNRRWQIGRGVWQKYFSWPESRATHTGSMTHFSVNHLLAGVPLETVSILLGHSSTRVTERRYFLG